MKLTLTEKQQETPTIYSFTLNPLEPFQYQAGQFIQISVPHDNADSRGIKRYFSIASSPAEKLMMVATRITANSSSLKKALLTLSEGTELELVGPYGQFILPEDIKAVHCIFITGGIGVTPVRSIFKDAVERQLTLPITLLYSNTTPEEIAFYDFFNELGQQNPNLDIVYTITKPEESQMPWSGRVGRIDKALVQEKIKDQKNTMFYVSGPVSLVENITHLLKEMNIPDQYIKRENFPGY